MDGIIKGVGGGGGGGGGRVGIGEEDMGDGMQCSDHPYRSNPGGICAFCLQEKLGKLVSSSFPLPIRGSSSSSSSPSFRSDIGGGGTVGVGVGVGGTNGVTGPSLPLVVRPTSTKGRNDNGNNSHYQEYYTRRARIPFLLAKKKKKIMVASSDRDIVFKRSKSTTTPARSHFLDASATDYGEDDFSPRSRRGRFWSFLYLSSSSSSKSNTTKKTEKLSSMTLTTTAATTRSSSMVKTNKEKCLGSNSLSKKGGDIVRVEEDDSPNSQATASASSFERKVSRSRSVGCGSRSFSGDFFERISTGFGDCTLRRVESQREGKPKVTAATSNMKERVKCGGIFGGFMITSSSSSSSSSSYWVSSSAEDMNGKSSSSSAAAAAASATTTGPLAHGRSRSWGWAFASPMRAFTKPSSKDGKRDITSNKNTVPNLAAIPSLLAVRG